MKLNRRNVLRGLLGGAAVTVALPWFESLAPRSARASGGASPKRFLLYFWGNGIQPSRWIPKDEGASWTLSDQLMPLAPVKDVISVITGLEVKTGNDDAHISGPGGFLTGKSTVMKGGGDWTFGGPTLDQIIAMAVGGQTLYRSLEVGVQPGVRGLSHNGPDSMNPPESEHLRLYERLFGATFLVPGEDTTPDPTLAFRRSALDVVMADAKSLESRLGSVDRVRLDQHMTAVRDLELRIARLQETPIVRDSCKRPDTPAALEPIEGRPQMSARARVLADLTTMALACDQTRVASFWYSDPLSDVLYPNATAGHHQLTHDEPGDQPQVGGIVQTILEDFAYLVGRLRDTTEGESNLLDSTALLATSDVSEGRTHQIDEYPVIVAGTACGALKTGFHYRSKTKENASRLGLTLLRAMDVPTASFGEEAGQTDTGLSELES